VASLVRPNVIRLQGFSNNLFMDKNNSILFLGDVIPYKPVKFRNTYKTVINLECPIIKEGKPETGKINLSVKENLLNNIFNNNLVGVCIANNHILDYGVKGLESTLDELEKLNIKYFGINKKDDNKYNPLVIELNKIKIAFIASVCQSTSPIVELDNVVYLNLLNTDEMVKTIEKIKKLVNRVVIYIHWGIEESSYPAKEDIVLARKLIDAGCDIVIGSHAHSPQPIEKYKNGIIAYNLGNFIMPDIKNSPSYFDEKGMAHSNFKKRKMLWNRISWGLIIDMKNLEYKIKKYIYIGNRIIELPFTPLDKYIGLYQNPDNDSYDHYLQKHLERRTLLGKIMDYIYKPHVPQKIKKYYESRAFIKFK
jgi:hypothetical protein